ncbi:uncharacterized protein LOC123510721 [Portunus trituberculatus]|uniref:uncharacterized protein LOC123510721 n=1 Tax=Portunus trituberculatus TaxID=210409 RepID=UPI001E1CBC2D|nr:uncharacterized protein LOC123510721 [Portunus trituberculatus]
MRKMEEESVPWSVRINRFLFKYRNTPQSTTQQTPSQLLMNREVRTRLSMIQGDLTTKILRKQATQCEVHDKHARTRVFVEGDNVCTHFGGPKLEWVAGTILSKTGPLSYIVQLHDGRTVRRHVDHIRIRHLEAIAKPIDAESFLPDYILEPVIQRPDQIVPAPVEVLPTPPLPKMTTPETEASGGSKSPVPSITVPEAEQLVSTDSTLDTTPSKASYRPDHIKTGNRCYGSPSSLFSGPPLQHTARSDYGLAHGCLGACGTEPDPGTKLRVELLAWVVSGSTNLADRAKDKLRGYAVKFNVDSMGKVGERTRMKAKYKHNYHLSFSETAPDGNRLVVVGELACLCDLAS